MVKSEEVAADDPWTTRIPTLATLSSEFILISTRILRKKEEKIEWGGGGNEIFYYAMSKHHYYVDCKHS